MTVHNDAYEIPSRLPNQPLLRCPQCSCDIQDISGTVRCSGCNVEYPVIDGVVDLSPQQDYLYTVQSVTGKKLMALIEDCRKNCWSTSYRRLVESYFQNRSEPVGLRRKIRDIYQALNGRTVPGMLRSVYYESQSYHWLLTRLCPDSAVLDFGAGWNIISHVWARECKQLVASDATLERLQVSSLRAAEAGLKNITFVRTPASTTLPFPDKTFDIVLINGVLEWMPVSIQGNRFEIQRKVLEEVKRVLNPDGQVIVGIENRFAFADIIGFPEGHVGLPWVGVLPRSIGSLLSRLCRRGPMRVTTHSARGLKHLFKKAGFPLEGIAMFAPQPTYASYEIVEGVDKKACSYLPQANLRDHPAIQRHAKSKLANALLAPFSHCVGAFFGVATLGEFKCYLDELVDYVQKEAGLTLSYPLGRLRMKQTKVMFDARLEKSGELVHVCMGMSQEGMIRVQNESTSLKMISKLDPVVQGQLHVPSVLWSDSFRGHAVSIFSHVEGKPLEASAKPCKSWDITVQAVRQLRLISGAFQSQENFPTVGEIWKAGWQFLFSVCWAQEIDQQSRSIESILRPTAEELCAKAVFGHGDPMPGNIIYNAQTGIPAVIDWEKAGYHHPLSDEVASMAGHVRRDFKGIGQTILALLDMSPKEGPPEAYVALCPQACQVPKQYMTALIMVWLTHVQHGDGTAAMMDPQWLEQRAWCVVRHLRKLVARDGGV